MVSGIMTTLVGADGKRHRPRTSREQGPCPVSHPCCTEESGLVVSLWNLWGAFGTGLQHDATRKIRPEGGLSV